MSSSFLWHPKQKTLTFEFKMGFTDLLTIVFIVLKLTGQIAWPWLLVLSPSLISLSHFLVLFIIGAISAGR